MPMHNLALTGFLGLVLASSIWVCTKGVSGLASQLADREIKVWPNPLFAISLGVIAVLSVLRTSVDLWAGQARNTVSWRTACSVGETADYCANQNFTPSAEFFRPARADFSRASFIEKPDSWTGREIAEAEFRARWCKEKRNLTCANPLSPDAGKFAEPDEAEFQRAWKLRWSAYLASLPKTNMQGRDLRGADFSYASLEGVDLSGARLDGADLSHAVLENANLSGANLSGAVLWLANLRAANLGNATLDGSLNLVSDLRDANLAQASLKNAILVKANLVGANFSGTNLKGAFLAAVSYDPSRIREPDSPRYSLARTIFVNSNWTNVRLDGTDLSEVDLHSVPTFDQSFGDSSVVLPANHPPPCQWSKDPLDSKMQVGQWRGWIEASEAGETKIWKDREGNPIALPPPPGCLPLPAAP